MFKGVIALILALLCLFLVPNIRKEKSFRSPNTALPLVLNGILIAVVRRGVGGIIEQTNGCCTDREDQVFTQMITLNSLRGTWICII